MRPDRRLVLAALALALAGCSTGPAPTPPPVRESGSRAGSACDGVTYAEVRGRPPSYAPRRLADHPVSAAVCAAWWLPGAEAGLVPQGLAVVGDTAWVAGYDGSQPEGRRTCVVEAFDLRTLAVLQRTTDVTRDGLVCRHGGGLRVDRHGVWLAETHRLWLLDPAGLAVRRTWEVPPPVRGSFLVADGDRLGLGGWQADGPGRLFWYDVTAALTRDRLGAAAAVDEEATPRSSQGGFMAGLGGPTGTWFISSLAGDCGVLTGPDGVRRALVPGAEEGEPARGRLWVLSEASARRYQQRGEGAVPMLLALDPAAVVAGPEPVCAP